MWGFALNIASRMNFQPLYFFHFIIANYWHKTTFKGQSMHSNSRNTKLESGLGNSLFIEVIFEVIKMFEVTSGDKQSCKSDMDTNFDTCIFTEVAKRMKVNLAFPHLSFFPFLYPLSFSLSNAEKTSDLCQNYWKEKTGCTVPYLPNVSNVCESEEEKKIVFDLYSNLAKGKTKLTFDLICWFKLI